MRRVPGVIHHQQRGLLLEQRPEMGGRDVDAQRLEGEVAQRLHPAAQQGQQVGLLTERGPEHPVGKESGTELVVMGQVGGERRFADPAEPVEGADDQGPGRGPDRRQAGLEFPAHLRARDEVDGEGRRLEGDADWCTSRIVMMVDVASQQRAVFHAPRHSHAAFARHQGGPIASVPDRTAHRDRADLATQAEPVRQHPRGECLARQCLAQRGEDGLGDGVGLGLRTPYHPIGNLGQCQCQAGDVGMERAGQPCPESGLDLGGSAHRGSRSARDL